jgi:hypothetical protein
MKVRYNVLFQSKKEKEGLKIYIFPEERERITIKSLEPKPITR